MINIGDRADARANRARILCSARELLVEKGLAFDMRELALRAAVGMGTLYRNVATKEELCAVLLADIMVEATEVSSRALACEDPREATRLLIWGLLEFAERHGAVTRVLQGDGHEANAAQKERVTAQTVEVFQRAIDAGVMRGGLDASALADFTSGIFSAYLAVRRLRAAGEAVALCMDIVSNGIFEPILPSPSSGGGLRGGRPRGTGVAQ